MIIIMIITDMGMKGVSRIQLMIMTAMMGLGNRLRIAAVIVKVIVLSIYSVQRGVRRIMYRG